MSRTHSRTAMAVHLRARPSPASDQSPSSTTSPPSTANPSTATHHGKC
jgi:hypothetical protein